MYLDCTNGVDEYALLKVLGEYLQDQFDVLPTLNELFRVSNPQVDVETWINNCAVDETIKNDMRAIVHNLTEAGIALEPKNWVLIGSVSYLFRKLNMEQILAGKIGIMAGTEYATAKLLEGAKIHLSYEGKGCSYLAAAILKHFIDGYGDMPGMTLEKVVHAETVDNREIDAYIGELEVSLFINELVCNIDDMTAEELAYTESLLYENGALDVYLTNIHMKKNRPGQMLTVMCKSEDKEKMLELIFQNTTTLGVREYTSKRHAMEHEIVTKETPLGTVHTKVAEGYGAKREKIEFEDLVSVAKKENISVLEAKKRLG